MTFLFYDAPYNAPGAGPRVGLALSLGGWVTIDFSSGVGLRSLRDVGQRPAEAGDALEGLLHGVGGAQHLAVAAEAADHLQAERHLLVVDAAGQRRSPDWWPA